MDEKIIFKKYNLDLSKKHIYNDTKKIFIRNNYSDTYGELTNKGLKALFKNIDTNNKIFYDLGSGTGNTLFRSAINHSLKKSIGIELSYNRYKHSLNLLNKINCQQIKNKIEFKYGDIITENFEDADIIYLSNCCFRDEINKKIGEKIKNSVKSNCIIFCSKELFLDIPFEKITVSQTWSENTTVLKYILGH